jgi:ribosomal protein S18 acetylase RimI-like enzyme
MEIRRLTSADWESYRALRLEALERSPEAFAADLAEQVANPPEYWQNRAAGSPDSFTMGAFLDGRLVGMATLIRQRGKKTRHKAEVVAVYVTPDLRGKGVARRLMAELIAAARQMEGLEQITLTVVAENRPARQLYLGLGFRVYGTEPRSLRVGERYYDEDDMVLFL